MNDPKEQIKVSVIVPVYNVEKYVERCIQSIISQTLSQIEIIIINDGTEDSSYEICSRMTASDSRITLISQENKGLGEARNNGMNFAHGEYLAFIDSDDYIEKDYLKDLYNYALSSEADVIEGDITYYYESTGEYVSKSCERKIENIKISNDSYEKFLRTYYYTNLYTPFACDKLYKRSFVQKAQAKFGDNKRIFAEDVWFQLQILRHHPSVSFCSSAKYVYRQREKSIMNAPKKDLIKRQITAAKDYYDLFCRDKQCDAESNIIDLLMEEAIAQEAINQAKFHGNWKCFYKEVLKITYDDFAVERIKNLYRNKSYSYVHRNRRWFLAAIGILFCAKQYKIAFMLYWFIYKIIYTLRRG